MFGIFKKKKVKYLGRGGIIYTHEGVPYIIDSEMLDGKDYDLVVYKKSVERKDNTEIVPVSKKDEVLSSLIDYLKNEECLRVELA